MSRYVDIDIYPTHVEVLGVRINRPTRISVYEWIDFWTAAVNSKVNKIPEF